MRVTANLFDLSGKTALVTGGNGGIGLGYARGMARQGANIVIWGRDQAKNRAAEGALREAGSPRVVSSVVDVSLEAAVRDGFAQAVDQMGPISCVISNAGHATKQPSLVETSTEAWHSLLDVHLNGGFYLVREAARHMSERSNTPARGGSILICGSLAVFAGGEGIEHYGAAKAGLAGLMKGAAAGLGKHGIRVNMVAPGYVATEMSSGAGLDETFLSARTPLGRVGSPSDFEGIAAYLASDAAAYHTGDIITIDGGWMASFMAMYWWSTVVLWRNRSTRWQTGSATGASNKKRMIEVRVPVHDLEHEGSSMRLIRQPKGPLLRPFYAKNRTKPRLPPAASAAQLQHLARHSALSYLGVGKHLLCRGRAGRRVEARRLQHGASRVDERTVRRGCRSWKHS